MTDERDYLHDVLRELTADDCRAVVRGIFSNAVEGRLRQAEALRKAVLAYADRDPGDPEQLAIKHDRQAAYGEWGKRVKAHVPEEIVFPPPAAAFYALLRRYPPEHPIYDPAIVVAWHAYGDELKDAAKEIGEELDIYEFGLSAKHWSYATYRFGLKYATFAEAYLKGEADALRPSREAIQQAVIDYAEKHEME